jgi:outer membrane protein TolC
MMYKLKLSGFALLWGLSLLMGHPARAQLSLSLEEARQHAIRHNLTLANAGLAVDEAGARLREAIAQGLPQISATVDYNNFFGSTASLGAFPGMEIEFNPTSNLSVSFGQLIFSGSYIVGVQTARLFREVTQTSREKTELDIRAQVTQAYVLVLVARESQQIVSANLDNLRDLQGKTRAMVDAGVAEEVDYDQLAVQVTMLEDAVRQAERQTELAMSMLRLQLGAPAEEPIHLTDDLEDVMRQSDFRGSLGSPFTLQQNPDFRLVSLQTGLAGKQVRLEQSAYLPTLSGFYNYTEKLLKPEFDITPNHVIGLNLSIPIFSSGVRQHKVRQARINLEVAENQKELVSHQLRIQEKQLRFNLSSALEQYESQQKNIEVARRVWENFQNKYNQGLVSSLDMITANNNFLQAQGSYVNAMMQLTEAQVALDALLGSL